MNFCHYHLPTIHHIIATTITITTITTITICLLTFASNILEAFFRL